MKAHDFNFMAGQWQLEAARCHHNAQCAMRAVNDKLGLMAAVVYWQNAAYHAAKIARAYQNISTLPGDAHDWQ